MFNVIIIFFNISFLGKLHIHYSLDLKFFTFIVYRLTIALIAYIVPGYEFSLLKLPCL